MFVDSVSEKGGFIREWAYPRVSLSTEFYGISSLPRKTEASVTYFIDIVKGAALDNADVIILFYDWNLLGEPINIPGEEISDFGFAYNLIM